MKLREKLAEFIKSNLLGDSSIQLSEQDSLIDRGIIDSIGLVQIVSFVEEEAGVRISDEDIIPENFQTIVAIEQMVERLQSQ